MTKIISLALENYSASFPEEDSIAFSESSAEPNLEPYSPDADEAALDKEQEDLSEALGTVKTLDGIVSVLEGSEGVSAPSGRALMVAVEALCRIKLAEGKPTLPAFEEFSTNKQRKLTTSIALEGIKEWIVDIWNSIMKAISRAIEWFKTLFNNQKKNTETIVKKSAELLKDGKKASKATPSDPKAKVEYRSGFWAISIGDTVPNALSLLNHYKEHIRLISQIEHNFEQTEQIVLVKLTNALRAIHVEGTAYQDYLNDARSAILTNNLGRKANKQDVLGTLEEGFSLYEAPMVFGSKAVYRTGISSVLKADLETISRNIRFGVATIPGSIVEYVTDPLEPLPEYAYMDIGALILDHGKDMERADISQEKREYQLNALKKEIERIIKDKKTIERSSRRAATFFHALTVYLNYRKAMTVGVSKYDQNVSLALLSYSNDSKKLIYPQKEQNA